MSGYKVSVTEEHVSGEKLSLVYDIVIDNVFVSAADIPKSFIDNLICGKPDVRGGSSARIVITGDKVIFHINSQDFIAATIFADRVKLAAEFAKLRM